MDAPRGPAPPIPTKKKPPPPTEYLPPGKLLAVLLEEYQRQGQAEVDAGPEPRRQRMPLTE